MFTGHLFNFFTVYKYTPYKYTERKIHYRLNKFSRESVYIGIIRRKFLKNNIKRQAPVKKLYRAEKTKGSCGSWKN